MVAKVRFGIPKAGKIKDRLMDGLIGGGLGGAGVAVSSMFLGPVLGSIVGSSLVGALLDDQTGRIVAVNGVMDAVETLLMGGGA